MAFLIILILIFLNGFLAMAEISVVSSRRSKLEVFSQKGNKTARQVMGLVENPSRFLSTIQVGLTIIGLLTGIFSNDVFADSLASYLSQWSFLEAYSRQIAITLVVIPISFFSIFLGELLPKRIGLSNPEVFAMFFARPIKVLTVITFPFIWLLQATVERVFKVLRIKPVTDDAILEQEIKSLVEEGASQGSIAEIEQDLVENVFHMGDRKINSMMTHVAEVAWVETSMNTATVIDVMRKYHYSVYPVKDDTGGVVGIVHARAFLLDIAHGALDKQVSSFVVEALYFHETMSAYKVLERFRDTGNHFGFVVDEYGQVLGIITINDILDVLIGDIVPDENKDSIVRRDDGSWLVDGLLSFADFCKFFDINYALVDSSGFNTMGGLVLEQLKHIPKTGEITRWRDFTIEVIDMDGNRIDKLLIKLVTTKK